MQVGRVHIAVSYYYYNTYQYNKTKDRNRYICEVQSRAIVLSVLTITFILRECFVLCMNV